MKKCFKCGEEKPLSFFYKHGQMADGHLNKCICCTKKDVTKHRSENIETVRAYDRKRGSSKERIIYNSERMKKFREKFPEKYKAYSCVSNAVRNGTLEKPERCSICEGTGQIEGHHNDYQKPLCVVWLCAACHRQLHRDLKKAEL